MKININKKLFTFFIFGAALSALAVFYFIKNRTIHKGQETNIPEKEITEMVIEKNSSYAEDPGQPKIEEENKDKKESFAAEYENQSYRYSIKFPTEWFMNNDYSENNFQEKEISENAKTLVGGQTFWSNYRDINNYSPSQKPDDFYILALTVYKDESRNVDDFALKLGFTSDLEPKKLSINADGIEGTEYASVGLSEDNPKIAIIFQKDNLFYVFKMAFIGKMPEVAQKMEEVIRTFRIN